MADVDRDMHDPGKNYAYGVTQLGREIVPGDENDSKASLFEFARDVVVALSLDGFVGTGFQAAASPADTAHDFYVREGLGFTGAGTKCYVDATVSWILPSYASVAQRSLHSVASQVGATGIQDAAMEFAVNSLVGRTLRVQRKADAVVLTYAILSNTADFIETAGNPSVDGVEPGCSYCVLPNTVTLDRTDLVCLNTWVGEADYREDPELLHPLIGSADAMSRKKMRNVVTVVEDVNPADPLASLPADYVDAYGDSHTFVGLAALTRHAGDDTIAGGDIDDLRYELKDVDKFLLLDCSNGPLTGPLEITGLLTPSGGVEMGTERITGNGFYFDFNSGDIACGALYPLAIDTNIIGATNAVFGGVRSDVYKWPELGDAHIQALIDVSYPDDLTFETLFETTTALTQIRVGFPRLDEHAATKRYVDYQVRNHEHPRYLAKESLEAMQAMLTPTQALALILAAYGGSTIPALGSIVWTHNLGTEYVLVQVRFRPTALDPWEENQVTGLKWYVRDLNSIGIKNVSAGEMDGSNMMAVAFSVPTVRVINVTDTFAVDAFRDSTETLVTP